MGQLLGTGRPGCPDRLGRAGGGDAGHPARGLHDVTWAEGN